MSEAKITISAVDATGAGIASVRGRFAQLAAEGSALRDKFVGISSALGALAAGGALAGLFRGTVNGIDQLNDLADATGASIEGLSALEDAARRTGTGVDVVGSALIKLNKTIADAKPGSDAAEALKAIGLSAKQLRDIDPAEALLRVAKGLSSFSDDGNKARLTQELFGKSLREVAPLLKDLVEQGQLNATVTKEQADAVETFNKRSFALQKTLVDLARTAVMPVVEAANAMSDALRGSDVDFEKLSGQAQALAVPLQALAVLGANVAFVFNAVGREVGILAAQAVALATQGLSAAAAIGQAAREEAQAARGNLDDFERRILGLGRATSTTAKSARDLLRVLEASSAQRPSAPVVMGKQEASEFDKFVRKLQEAQVAALDLSEVERTRLAFMRPELAGLTNQQKDYLLVLSAINDEMRGRVQVFEDARDAQLRLSKAPRANGDALDRVFKTLRGTDETNSRNLIVNADELAAQSRQAQIRQLADAMSSVRDQMEAGGISAEKYRQAMDVLGERMRALEDNAQGLSEKLGQGSEEAKALAADLQGAFGASLLSSMEGNARKIDRIWGDLLRRMVAGALSAKLMESLFGKDFSSKGETGGLLGRLVGAFGGGGSAGSSAGNTNSLTDVVKNSAANSGKTSLTGMSKGSQASAPGVVQNVYVQGDVGTRARRAMLGVAAQMQSRQQRAAAL